MDNEGGTVTLSHCNLSVNSSPFDNGGGISNTYGTLSMSDCILSGNSTGSGEDSGGGIVNGGTATLTNCTLSNNFADYGSGGGIENYGTLTLANCTLSGNHANNGFGGGGIDNNGTATLTNCTLSNNAATGGGFQGAGFQSVGAATLTNCTLLGNRTAPGNPYGIGGVLNLGSEAITLNNCVVANSIGADLGSQQGGPINVSYSLIGDGGDGVSGTRDHLLTGDPMLGALQNNGGPTQTMMPQAGSPAINAGSVALAVDQNNHPLVTDQRGAVRVVNGLIDIGAVESAATVPPQGLVVTTDQDTDSPPQITLRDAILYAEFLGGAETVTFNGGSVPGAAVNFYDGNPHAITLAGSELLVGSGNVNIQGPGAKMLTISGNAASRVFEIGSGVTANIDQLTITNGKADAGGGILNSGTLSVTNSTVSSNAGTSYGGGIYDYLGALTVINSTLSNNWGGVGGGIYNYFGSVSVINSTLANNATDYAGGGIDSNGTVSLTDSTLCNNGAGYYGGGIGIGGGSVIVGNTIIAGNSAGSLGGPDVYGPVTSQGYNLIGNTAESSGFGATGDIQNPGSGAMLSSLGNYGGPTQTMVPLPGSPVIGAGSVALAVDQNNHPLTTDQRGLARTINGNVDIGAVEAAVTTLTGPASTPSYGQSLSISASVANATGGFVDFYVNGGMTPAATMPVLAGGASTATLPNVNAGGYSVTSVYRNVGNSPEGNGNSLAGSINKANATVNVAGYSKLYSGNPQTATGSASGVNGEDLSSLLNLSGTTHTNVGTYNSDPWSFAGNTNYNGSNGTVNDSVGKANANISVMPYSAVPYDGNPHIASGTATGVQGEDLSSLLTLSGTTHTNAGNYSDSWSFAGNGNYNASSGNVGDSIAKIDPTISITGYTVNYDASAQTATGTAKGIGGVSLAGLNLSGTTHTNAGTYNGDSWSFTDPSGNYNTKSGSVNDAINKIDPTVTVTPYNVAFDGNAHTATGSATGIGGGSLAGLNLTGTTHTLAGNYTDTWTFSDPTGNYNNKSGQVNDVIGGAGILGLNSVTIKGNGTVDAYNSSTGYPGSKSNNAQLSSNGTIDLQGTQMGGNIISSLANLIVESGTVVTGNATYSTTLTNQGTINGQKLHQTSSAFAAPVPASFSTFTGAGNWITGTYTYTASKGDLTVSGGNTATLAAGTYYFHNVTLSGGATLKVSGLVVIHLMGTFTNSGGSMTSNSVPGNLQIISSYTGGNGVTFSGGTVNVAVYAPGTDVTLSGNTVLFGAVFGKTLTASGSSAIHYDLAFGNAFSTTMTGSAMTPANPGGATHKRK